MDNTETKEFVVVVDGERTTSHVTEAQAQEAKEKLAKKIEESHTGKVDIKVVKNLFG